MLHKRNIHLLYISIFFNNLIFAYVIERLFWESRSMTIQDVVFTEIIYVLLLFVLEIPAGIVSDKHSRKFVLILAGFFQVLEFLIVIFSYTFFHFALAVGAAAISQALISGTFNSLVYESLVIDGQEKQFPHYLGRLEALDGAVIIGVLVLGGFIAEKMSFVSMYWLGAASALIAVLVLFFIKEPNLREQREKHTSFSLIKKSLKLIFHNKKLLSALFAGVSVGSIIIFLDEFMTLHLRDGGLPIWSFGIVLGTAYFFRSLGSLLGERFENLSQNGKFFTIALSLFLGVQILFGYVSIWISLGLIAFLYFSWGVLEVLSNAQLHAAAQSEFRATAESLVSQIEQILGLVFGLVFSSFAKTFSIPRSISYTALVGMGIFLLFLIFNRSPFNGKTKVS